MRLLIYTPKTDKPVAAFLGLNFQGNHSVDDDPSISVTSNWVRTRKHAKTDRNKGDRDKADRDRREDESRQTPDCIYSDESQIASSITGVRQLQLHSYGVLKNHAKLPNYNGDFRALLPPFYWRSLQCLSYAPRHAKTRVTKPILSRRWFSPFIII